MNQENTDVIRYDVICICYHKINSSKEKLKPFVSYVIYVRKVGLYAWASICYYSVVMKTEKFYDYILQQTSSIKPLSQSFPREIT